MKKTYTEPEATVVSFEVAEDMLGDVTAELGVISTAEEH